MFTTLLLSPELDSCHQHPARTMIGGNTNQEAAQIPLVECRCAAALANSPTVSGNVKLFTQESYPRYELKRN